MDALFTPSALCAGWKAIFAEKDIQANLHKALAFVQHEKLAGKIIYPAQKDIFKAFYLTPFDKVKVIILGQDPYHNPGQAQGLAFSIPKGIPLPPSLRNIFKELHHDIGAIFPTHGCLEKWAKQGVLLLNAFLTVEASKPLSHANIGWEVVTDKIIQQLAIEKDGLIFLLWGMPAQKKAQIISAEKHFILKAAHPSPLSAHRGFLGCRHFSKTNAILRTLGKKEIDWQIE